MLNTCCVLPTLSCELYKHLLPPVTYYVSMLIPDYGIDKYDIGTGFGHFGIAVEDVSLLNNVSSAIIYEPHQIMLKHSSSDVYMFRLPKLWIS